ncbi:sushi, von Willebrand factor type A, EGF and pentraxin domain-containing protein 1-like [Ylistrum balloti]|uniref:sushi, von Willebrand factor type A, EGF and pentraxin domain-containing protein 1-like n=1 Tax=Ylistrum balloti TaxID=509963 RepID=UPI002905F64D|nr:sushi, von Willebrand factor type A, EGF and pentraxin domain-containing protein 1-like [Ylistrum balloti]
MAKKEDITPPQLECPPDQHVYGDPFQTHAKVNWITPTAWDFPDGTVSVQKSSSRNSGYPISEPGATIGFYARDRSGNMAKCNFNIYVTVIRCPVLKRMTDGYVICHRSDDMVLGSYCEFGCYEGHELIGPNYTECLSTGRWSSWTIQQPGCQKHSCGPLLPSPLLSITYTNGNLFRSIATFTCTSGYDVPVGMRRVSVCGVDQLWSAPVPNCVDIERPSFKRYPSSKTFYIARHDVTVAVYWEAPEVEDNSGDILAVVQIAGPSQGDALEVGTYTVTYTATDSAGNTARPLNFKITVREIRCFHVYPTPYTSVTCTGNRLGSTCRFECSDGATLNASSSITSCEQEGTPPYGLWDWGTQQPFCELSENCQLPEAPDNGALACDYWLGGRFCQPQCQMGYDISVRSTAVDLLICNDDGSLSWDLPLPNCMRSSSSRGTRRTVEVVFFTGSCTDESTQMEIKQNFIQKLQSTSFSHGCDISPKCSWKNVKVICGNTNGKRSTGFTITFDIALNSSAVMDGEEYYSQFMEGESLIESLRVDMALGTLTIQMNDNTTTEAAEILKSNLGLQCEENTVASMKTFTCVECQSGSYYDAASEECVLCPIGQYQSESRKSTCVQCPYGTSTSTTGSSSPTSCQAACPPGSSSPSSLPPCTPCDIGYYQSEYGATVCSACPGNKITKNDNSSSETDCVEFDVYFPDNQTAGVILGQIETLSLTEYTVVWWQQCSTVCIGEVFALNDETGTNSLTVQMLSTIVIGVDGQTINSGLTVPDDGEWHVFMLKRRHACLECYMDMSLVMNITEITVQSVFGGVVKLGGTSFEGTISQLNVFTESNPLVTDRCFNDATGDVVSWRSILNATMNDAFIQIPSVCDDIKECDSNPCIHGNCTDEYHRYQCQCDVGYTGSDCDVDIDDCDANSCQNNATCQDSVNNYTCQCLPNFTGVLCEIAFVDGGWNAWGNWTECSVTCGNGTQTRIRACDNPAPDNGGAECAGDRTETEICVQETCPECGELVPPANGSLNCANDGVDTVCELECDEGFATDIPIPDNYTCGNSTFDQWDFKIDTNVFTRLPSCIATTDPDDMRAIRTSYYDGLDCDTLMSNEDSRITVLGKLGVVVNSLTGVQNNDCKEDQKFINTCEDRRKRDTSSDSAGYSVMLHCDSKSKGAAECYEILTQAVIDLERLEELGETNIIIDGVQYIVNISQSVSDSILNCPVGMVEVFSFCVPCGPGRYYTEDECELCDIGSYQDTTQQTFCKACPSGTSTEGTGSISITECSVLLPVEDSAKEMEEATIGSVGMIAGIVAGTGLVITFIAILTIKRL